MGASKGRLITAALLAAWLAMMVPPCAAQGGTKPAAGIAKSGLVEKLPGGEIDWGKEWLYAVGEGAMPSPQEEPNPLVRVSSGTISGVVTDQRTGKPVPEATVQIIDSASNVIVSETVPNADGGFKETVKPGGYTVKAVCDGYRPSGKSVTVLEDKSRIVRLAIAARTPDEPATPAATQLPTRTVAVPVAMPSQAGGVSPRPAPAAPAPGAGSPRQPATTAGENPTDKLVDQASQLYRDGKKQDALDILAKAVQMDPSDGRLYAKLVLINNELGNTADAKDWASEGKQKAKKNKSELDRAVLELQ